MAHMPQFLINNGVFIEAILVSNMNSSVLQFSAIGKALMLNLWTIILNARSIVCLLFALVSFCINTTLSVHVCYLETE